MPHRLLRPLTALLTAGLAAAPVAAAAGPSWRLLDTGSTERFRGLSVVDSRIAWVGGYDGTVLRTVDGGQHWSDVSPAGAGALQFRDIEAFGARTAVAMSVGDATDSFRMYRTTDGGAHWQQTFTNDLTGAFYDCMTFLDGHRGFAVSDPVDGHFRILATGDGGAHWRLRSVAGMPAALDGEAGFAGSGTCLTGLRGTDDLWFGTGGADTGHARVFASTDAGRHWSVTSTPLAASASSGIFSLAFRSPTQGLAVGGNYLTPKQVYGSAVSSSAGRHWHLTTGAPGGYRSGMALVPGTDQALAVGPTGSDLSTDGGKTWSPIGTGGFDAVACAADGSCWASGMNGRVARLSS